MAFTFNIPEIKDKPIIVAETRPSKISQSLAEVHHLSPLEVASHIYGELEILNRQKVSASTRIQALDAYRPLVLSTALALAEHYTNATLPLHDKAKLAAGAAELLWLELGFGYKIAIVDLQNQLIKLGAEKNIIHATAHAIHALSEHAMVCYQTYVTPPTSIWADLHQLYFQAAQMGVQHHKAASNDASLNLSIESSYKHALLMHLADPQHLTQPDIRLVANYLGYHVNSAQISATMPLEFDRATFTINLSSDEPPIPHIKRKKSPDEASDIFLNTIDLVRTIHQQLGSLQKKQFPKDGSIPSNANLADYVDLLTYLIKHWGIIPKRVFSRSQKNGEIELVTGIAAIHYVSDLKPLATNVQNLTIESADGQSIKQVMPSRWQVLNISATGMAVRRHPTADKNIKVDSLVGIRTKDEKNWALGIVRWASCADKERLDIGVQLIAPLAHTAIATIDGRESEELVLLLPEINSVNQASTILAPRGTFAPARQLTLQQQSGTIHIMLTKIVDRSHHFERMQFSIIA